MAQILILLSIGLPWIGAVAVWAIGDQKRQTQQFVAVCFALAAGAAALALIPFATDSTVIRVPAGNFFGDLTFIPDGLGVFLACIATVVGSLAVIFSIDYMHGDTQLGRYYALILLFIGAMVGLVLTGSFLFLFFFWEITAFCSYALISFYNDDPKAVAGGIKALIITQIGGVGLLAGALTSYAYFGNFEISNFLSNAASLPAQALGLIGFGFLIAAAAKSAQVPFQTWLPDAMEAPTPVSALIHAATMVNAGVYLLARFYPAFAPVPGWKTAVVIVGVLSALLAAIMAVVAVDLKRVLAYSTVSQLGYMVYAVGVGGVYASQFHLFSHAIFKALLFLSAGAVIHAAGTRDMRQMGGLGPRMPFVRNVFIVGAFALAGLPVLNGFWSKELVLEAGLEAGPGWAYFLMLIGAGLTAFYTFRMVSMVFFGAQPSNAHIHDAGPAMRTALGPLAVGTLTTWLLAGPFGALLQTTLPFHHLETGSTTHTVLEVVTAPATYAALGVVLLGFVVWTLRDLTAGLKSRLGWLARMAANSFGFEWINQKVIRITQNSAETLRITQTGQLNWNLVGIVGTLAAVLAFFAAVLASGA